MNRIIATAVGAILCLITIVQGYRHGVPTFPRPNLKAAENKQAGYGYKTRWYTQVLDHFNYLAEDKYFEQRYLVNDTFFKKDAPVFFYSGNEGDIAWFCNNTGFMWEISPQFNAMVVCAEHRYYGMSLPFGNDSYKDAVHLGYLTSEQALADFATLIDHIRKIDPRTKRSPFIAFGGSYGGMLASWFRMKYPAQVAGAIAASAPILGFPGMCNCELFYKVCTDDFRKAGGDACVDSVRRSWDTITKMAQTALGRKTVYETFKLCEPLKKASDIYGLIYWLSEAWAFLAMELMKIKNYPIEKVDYPYPANFLELLPAYPIKEVCKHMQEDDAQGLRLVRNIAAGANVYFNYTGKAKCLKIGTQATTNLGENGWNFQACTEMTMPLCQDGVKDMWYPVKWDFRQFSADCKKQFGVTTRKHWAQSVYGGFDLSKASNIVFSNGDLDPWYPYGVLKSDNPSIVTVMIEGGAHHLDLRNSNKKDPKAVIKAREIHKENIRKWIKEWHMHHLSNYV